VLKGPREEHSLSLQMSVHKGGLDHVTCFCALASGQRTWLVERSKHEMLVRLLLFQHALRLDLLSSLLQRQLPLLYCSAAKLTFMLTLDSHICTLLSLSLPNSAKMLGNIQLQLPLQAWHVQQPCGCTSAPPWGSTKILAQHPLAASAPSSLWEQITRIRTACALGQHVH